MHITLIACLAEAFDQNRFGTPVTMPTIAESIDSPRRLGTDEYSHSVYGAVAGSDFGVGGFQTQLRQEQRDQARYASARRRLGHIRSLSTRGRFEHPVLSIKCQLVFISVTDIKSH